MSFVILFSQWRHRRSQHEARGGNCLLLNFQIDNDFASCFASSHKKMIKISTNYHKLVFVFQRCSLLLKLSNNDAEFKNFPGGNTPDSRFRGGQSLFLLSENIRKL